MSQDQKLLQGKVALVTGAGGGLGRTHALALAAAGARVIVNDLGTSGEGESSDPSRAEAVVAEIAAAGGDARADATDMSNWQAASALVDRVVEQSGALASWSTMLELAGSGRSAILRNAAGRCCPIST